MTIKEKVINKSISEVEMQLNEINFILNATPLTEIVNIRFEAQKLLEENRTLEQRTSNVFLKKIEDLSRREKELFVIAKKSENSSILTTKKVKLEIELTDLKNELFHIERKR